MAAFEDLVAKRGAIKNKTIRSRRSEQLSQDEGDHRIGHKEMRTRC